MTVESTKTAPRSRRALLAGALGGLSVWAASVIGRAAPTEADAGDPIRMGRLNKASSTATTLQTKTSAAAYQVIQIGAGAAVKGVSTSGRAIMGEAGHNGTGVWAYSPNHNAVSAFSFSGSAVEARTESGYAVNAWSVSGAALYAASSSDGHAAIFGGKVRMVVSQDFQEMLPEPSAPGPSMVRLFARDNGSGKTQLCVRFATGAVQALATEP